MYLDVNWSSDEGSFSNLGVIYDDFSIFMDFSVFFDVKSMITCDLGPGLG